MSSFITLFKTFFSLNLLDFMISIPYAFAFASLAFCQIWKKKNIFWHKNIKHLSLFQIFLHFYCFLDDRLWKLIYFNIQYFFLYLLICTVIHQLSTSSFLFSQIYLHVSQCFCYSSIKHIIIPIFTNLSSCVSMLVLIVIYTTGIWRYAIFTKTNTKIFLLTFFHTGINFSKSFGKAQM